jgi:hypothetical protein
MGKGEIHTKFCSENLKRRKNVREVRVGKETINKTWQYGLHSTDNNMVSVVGCCEQISIKVRPILGY